MHQPQVVWTSNTRPPAHPIDTVLRTLDSEEFKSVRQSVVSCDILPLVRLSSRHVRVDVQYLHDCGLEKNTERITTSLWPLTGKIDQKSKRDFFF